MRTEVVQLINQLEKQPEWLAALDEMNRHREVERTLRKYFLETVQAGQKAEFINGEIVMQSPARGAHLDAMAELLSELIPYVKKHKLGKVYCEKAMLHFSRNNFEPDICFFPIEVSSKFTKSQKLYPAPTLIAEVLSPSTESIDRGVKFIDYARHGVAEYWIIDPDNETVEQYVLVDEAYQLHTKAVGKGRIASTAIAGFELEIRPLFQ